MHIRLISTSSIHFNKVLILGHPSPSPPHPNWAPGVIISPSSSSCQFDKRTGSGHAQHERENHGRWRVFFCAETISET
jgi:hypothetical protein